jgi:hypothetical protein
MGRRKKRDKLERDKAKFGDPVLAAFLEQDDRKDTFWYDFLHLDIKEVIAWIIATAFLFWCVCRN